jgi:hypothetical protein
VGNGPLPSRSPAAPTTAYASIDELQVGGLVPIKHPDYSFRHPRLYFPFLENANKIKDREREEEWGKRKKREKRDFTISICSTRGLLSVYFMRLCTCVYQNSYRGYDIIGFAHHGTPLVFWC